MAWMHYNLLIPMHHGNEAKHYSILVPIQHENEVTGSHFAELPKPETSNKLNRCDMIIPNDSTVAPL